MSFFSDLAETFAQLAQNLQTRLTNAGPSLDDATRSALEDQRDGLIDQSNQMIVQDVQTALSQLNLDQARLAACTTSLNNAVKNLQTFDKIVAIGEAGLNLAAACVSANPDAIIAALAGAEKAVSDALGKSKVVTMPSAASPPKGSAAGTVTSLAASSGSDDPQT